MVIRQIQLFLLSFLVPHFLMFIIVSISIVFPHSRPRFNIRILEVKRFLWQGTVVPVDAYSHIMTTGRSELGHPQANTKICLNVEWWQSLLSRFAPALLLPMAVQGEAQAAAHLLLGHNHPSPVRLAHFLSMAWDRTVFVVGKVSFLHWRRSPAFTVSWSSISLSFPKESWPGNLGHPKPP